jgi:hypothetical protein
MTNFSESIRSRFKNLSKKENIAFQEIMILIKEKLYPIWQNL